MQSRFGCGKRTTGVLAGMEAFDWFLLWAAVSNGRIWAQPNYIIPSPVIDWSDVVISINLPVWIPYHVLTVPRPFRTPTITATLHNPTIKVESHGHNSFEILWRWCCLWTIMSVENRTWTVDSLHTRYSFTPVSHLQSLLIECVFKPVIHVSCTTEKKVKQILGLRILPTKYPAAVSGTNCNKSFSKATVVNRNVLFFFFSRLAITENGKAPSPLQRRMAQWWKGRKKETNKTIFLLSCNFAAMAKMKQTLNSTSRRAITLIWPLICLWNSRKCS